MASFRTKSGHVEVSTERLEVVRTGARGKAARALQGDSRRRTLLLYGAVVLLCAWEGWSSLRRDHVPLTVIWWSFGGWIGHALLRPSNFSMAPMVERAAATRIEAVRGIPGLTRDRLVVHFREEGRDARRFILMPGVLQEGRGELERALSVLREARWPVEGEGREP